MEDVPVKSHSARPALGSLAMLWRFARRYPGRIAGALLALIVFVGVYGGPLYTVADRAAYALFAAG